MGKTPPFFIFLRARPFFFMGWAFLTFKGLIPSCNFEPQHPGSLNAQEKKWDDQATKTKRNKSWSQLQTNARVSETFCQTYGMYIPKGDWKKCIVTWTHPKITPKTKPSTLQLNNWLIVPSWQDRTEVPKMINSNKKIKNKNQNNNNISTYCCRRGVEFQN